LTDGRFDAVSIPAPSAGEGTRARWLLVGLGLFLTLLNAPKPITVDDSVYHLFAAHIAEHPLDPYGFRAWGVQDANTILAPPVFLYWWALAVRLFGQHPVLWKLWLLPFNLLLVFVLHALGRRFARGMEMPFVFIVTLSAAVLPCVNLMLDVPALGLSLLAVVLFLRAASANSLLGAAAAGLVAGVAAQTKYTAFVAPGVMLLHSLLFGRWRLALLAASLVAATFVGWELLIAWRYGDSHFWLGCMQYHAPPSDKVRLVQPLFGYLGSTIAAALPLALAALGRPARLVWAVAALVALVFALVAFPIGSAFDALPVHIGSGLSGVLFGVVGASLVAALAVVAGRLLRRPLTADGSPAPKWYVSVDAFLALWLLLEVAGYFALSPYPATRRVLGVAVLGTLLACRLAARTCADRAGLVWGVAGLNFLLGLLLFAVDFGWYYGPEVMAHDLAGECRRQGPAAKVWYFGNGTFEFYAGPLGMRRVVGPDAPVASGDWVLVVNGFEPSYSQHPVSSRCVFQGVREWRSILPVRSQYQFGNVALARQETPLARVTLYRVP
jgi:hypothetical protein